MATFHQKMKLLQGLLSGEVARTGPFYLTVDITRRCNLSCKACRYHSTGYHLSSPGDQGVKDIPFSLFERLCYEFKGMGTTGMFITGEGEPLLHPRIFDMISVAKGAGFKITLFTNATLLDESRVLSLIDSGLDTLRVSLWASSPENFKRFYPRNNPKYFGRIVEGLKLLSRLKKERKSVRPFVSLHTVINHFNFGKIEEMADLAHRTGCNAFSMAPIKSWRGELDSLILSGDEEKAVIERLSGLKKRLDSLSLSNNIDTILLRYRIGEAVWERLPCYIGWYHCRIKVDGLVMPCNSSDMAMGDLKKESFRHIWNNENFRSFRRQTLTCKGLASLVKSGVGSDCGYCSYIEENMRIDRFFKWVAPLTARST